MFAILLSEKMDPFYQNISSFPTVLFTILLVLCVLFWAGAVLGFVDLDILDIDTDLGDLNSDSSHTGPDVLAGLLLRLGLTGVPVTVSLSILVLFGWIICYYAVFLINPIVPGRLLEVLVGIPIFVGSVYVAALITAQLIKPLRPLFEKATQETHKQLLGQVAIVRTSRVDRDFGEATVEDGGAGLILKVRTTGSDTFKRGDRVVLIERIDDASMYRVVSEDEFVGD
ncbi:MAG: DUF1449 domain-containing protein [Pseudomonadota bacterium]